MGGSKIFFHNSRLTIINDDVLTTREVQPESIDLVVTSPPYNVNIKYNSHDDSITYEKYKEFSREWMARCFEWLRDDGRFCLNVPLDKNRGGQQSVGADLTSIAKDVGFKYHSTIVWNESNISRRTAWGSFQSASAPFVIAPVELIIVLYKTEWKKQSGSKESDISKKDFIDWTNGLWTFSGESKKKIGHPAPFPIELPRRCMKLFSYVDDTVLDPFLGSGTTLVAASLNERKGIGIDIDSSYCSIALERLKKEGKLEQLDLSNYLVLEYKQEQGKKHITQLDILMDYFKQNPSRNISYADISDWITQSGLNLRYSDRRLRELVKKGKIIKVKEGIFRYNPLTESYANA
jgi:site-specific DNA-methyltransferase (adenine-specific)